MQRLLTILKAWGASVCAAVEPVWQHVKTWCVDKWTCCSAWYLAQQEVIKKQSEVSHERITIKRAVLAFMETWGLGSRNIFYTMWHLIWRPGYMISDYLNGHRKRYLQPFFMFFVLTLILVQMVSMLTMVCFRTLPFDHIRGFAILPELILFVILLIDFKQLFQRDWWPTIWRTALIVVCI